MEFDKKQPIPFKKVVNSKYRKIFSVEELDELKSAYSIYEDENGLINVEKIYQIINNLGYDSSSNIMEMLKYLNSKSSNNMINFNDYLEACEKYLGSNTPDKELKEIYAMFTDKGTPDSVITYESFKKILVSFEEEMSEEDFKILFTINSKNKEFMNFDDFKKIMKRKFDI